MVSVRIMAAQADWETLQGKLREIAVRQNVEVGIAVILDGHDTLVVNNDKRYPMMSVFKFHQALAVAGICAHRGLSFEDSIRIDSRDLRPDTYSPLRDRYPHGNLFLSIGDLLEYTLQLSDNNACDILFREFGGPVAADSCLRRVGLHDFAIVATEDDMHAAVETCYGNWTSPLEAARLLDWFVTNRVVTGEYKTFIEHAMTACRTGSDRLPVPLAGTKAVLGHKTGTGDRNSRGEITGVNDIGFVLMPDGKRYTIAVFVKDVKDERMASRIIADVSTEVYRYVTGRN